MRVSGVVVSGAGDRMSRTAPLRAGLTDARVGRGRSILHTRAHSASTETAESCGTAMSVAGTVPLPCAQTPLTAHGSPTTAYDAYQKILSFQQKPAPAPQRPWSPMCNTDDKHTHQISPTTPRAEIGPIQLDQLDVEARTTSSRAKATCHAPRNRRRAADPRSTTDLDTSYDRSRAGTGPISTRSTTDLDAELDRSRCGCQAAYVIPRRRPSHSIWSAIATDHVAQVCLPA